MTKPKIYMSEEMKKKAANDLYKFALGYLKPKGVPSPATKEFLYQNALENLDNALGYLNREDELYPHIMSTKAQILSETGKIQEAIEAFQISIEKMNISEPKIPYIHAYYALTLLKNEDIDGADKEMAIALETMPERTKKEKLMKEKFTEKHANIKLAVKALDLESDAESTEAEIFSVSSDSGDESSLGDTDSGYDRESSPTASKKLTLSSIVKKLGSLINHKGEYNLIHNDWEQDDGIDVSGEIGMGENAIVSEC